MQPGQTISPGGDSDTNNASHVQGATPNQPQDARPTDTNTPKISSDENNAQSQEPSPWQYNQDDGVDQTQQAPVDIKPVNWSASEFIDHEKKSSWYLGLAGLTVLAVAIIYLITQDIITAVVIFIAAVLFGVTAKRRPRTLDYKIDNIGVIIDGKHFPYGVFKSFSVFAEGAFNSIQLMPLKRFMPPISLYFPPENEEQIVTTLGSYLPHEVKSFDPIDRLMRRVRF